MTKINSKKWTRLKFREKFGRRFSAEDLSGILIEPSLITEVLRAQIIQRELMEGDEAIHFERRAGRSAGMAATVAVLRKRSSHSPVAPPPTGPPVKKLILFAPTLMAPSEQNGYL
jgi:hypothetical protein